jgi:hypothetical protein
VFQFLNLAKDLVVFFFGLFSDRHKWNFTQFTYDQIIGQVEQSLLVIKSDQILNWSQLTLNRGNDNISLLRLGVLLELFLSGLSEHLLNGVEVLKLFLLLVLSFDHDNLLLGKLFLLFLLKFFNLSQFFDSVGLFVFEIFNEIVLGQV